MKKSLKIITISRRFVRPQSSLRQAAICVLLTGDSPSSSSAMRMIWAIELLGGTVPSTFSSKAASEILSPWWTIAWPKAATICAA